jgi:YHS domain-containing protein
LEDFSMPAQVRSSGSFAVAGRLSQLRAAMIFGVALFVAPALFGTGVALAKEAPIFTGIVQGVAVGGYDPVAYFTDKKPVEGKADVAHVHEGVTYRFSSAANRDAFKAAPAKFVPQYGGYCAWAVSQGYTAKGDPNVWSITDGKLYLNFNKSVQSGWEKDVPGLIKKADANWPTVLGK